MKIPNVDVEMTKEVKFNGYFMLICPEQHDNEEKEYIFEWQPDPKLDPNVLSEKKIPQSISASSQQVSEILKRDLSFTEVSLRFILVDSSRLPRFLFHKHPQLHVQHMLDVLSNDKIVITREDRPNAYRIFHQSTKTDADIFGYTPTSSLSASNAVSFAEHNEILKKLNYQPLANDVPPITIDEFNKILGVKLLPMAGPSQTNASNQSSHYDLTEVKKQIFIRGLSPEARPHIWPLLFGFLPATSDQKEIKDYLAKKLNSYKLIKEQINLHTDFQIEHSTELKDIKRTIYFDVIRNDRQLEAFSDDSPNLGLLETILTCYALYNRDTGYCQGMGDLASPLILIFIKGWTEPDTKADNKTDGNNENDESNNDNNNNENDNQNDATTNNNNDNTSENKDKPKNTAASPMIIINSDGDEDENMAGKDYSNGRKAIFYDGTIKTYEEAESFIFWNFVFMMDITHHFRLFSLLDGGKQFILERSATIATSVHRPLKTLLDKNELNGLDFLFRPVLLLFKREFKLEELLRLWDSMFASDYPFVFPRFVAASLLIIVYPKFLLHTNGSLGEMMAVLDGTMEKMEVKSVLQIAFSLIESVKEPFKKHKFIYEALKASKKLVNYVPKYLKFVE